ncbi:uncharacterized protein LOC133855045 [Alnus glutinosa]|uniref:uncharacterized protein LOC133855045 n=1 Tax=Alnus glutinosa TaxID=3517 RepID=UPI002D78EA63|nr:uncharacterized protein LOC133855045 [Alnus glutinosa]
MIYPMPSEDQWVRTGQDEVDPPVVRAAPGRPKKLRRRGLDEPRNLHCMRKGGVSMRCSKCRAVGYNARTCPGRKMKSTPSTATELSFDDIPSHPIVDDSQPTQSSTAAQPVSRPKKRVPPTTVGPTSMKRSKTTAPSMHTRASQRANSTAAKSAVARPIRRSGRLLAAFKEPNPNKEIPIVDLTRDDSQPETAPAIFTRELARASGVVILELVSRPTRVVVPTVEKGLQ